MIRVNGLTKDYGSRRAVDQITFDAQQGEILGFLGPNGAGKTTLFNMVSGVYLPSGGRVELNGEDVTAMEPHLLSRRGMSRTHQNLQVFFRLTAAENVMVGRHRHENANVLAHLFTLPVVTRQNRITRDISLDLLARLGLEKYADTPAGSMPYGALKRLEIARALALDPKILLLDEPAAGCNAVETEEIDHLIAEVAASGVAILLVEHDMKMVMRISNHIVVLDHGEKIAEGAPAAVSRNPAVIAAYLGVENADG